MRTFWALLIFAALNFSVTQAFGQSMTAFTEIVTPNGDRRIVLCTNLAVKAHFQAIVTNVWEPGLVPLFAVELRGKFRLRRLPLSGQENISEPIFFGLPIGDEENPLVAGRWRCVAIRGDGSKAYPDFEVATLGSRLAARFDQNTEYRFAFIRSGTLQENRFELLIENIADRYVMSGTLDAMNALSGKWRHLNGDEEGTWKAERDRPVFRAPQGIRTTELWEWLSESDASCRYLLTGENPGMGWKRGERPLCRVWLP